MTNNIENTFVMIPQKVWDILPETLSEKNATKIVTLPADAECSISCELLTAFTPSQLVASVKDTSKITHYYSAKAIVDWLKRSYTNPNNGEQATTIRFFRQGFKYKGKTVYVEITKCKNQNDLEQALQTAAKTKLEAKKVRSYKAYVDRLGEEEPFPTSANKTASPNWNQTQEMHSLTIEIPLMDLFASDIPHDLEESSRLTMKTQPEHNQPLIGINRTSAISEKQHTVDQDSTLEVIFAAFETKEPFTHEEIFSYCQRFPTLISLALSSYPGIQQDLFSKVPEEVLKKHQQTTLEFLFQGIDITGKTSNNNLIVDFLLTMAEDKETYLAAIIDHPQRRQITFFPTQHNPDKDNVYKKTEQETHQQEAPQQNSDSAANTVVKPVTNNQQPAQTTQKIGFELETLLDLYALNFSFPTEKIFEHCMQFPELVPTAISTYPYVIDELFSDVDDELLRDGKEAVLEFIKAGINLKGKTMKRIPLIEFLFDFAEDKEAYLEAIAQNPTRHKLNLFSLSNERILITLLASGVDVTQRDPQTGKGLFEFFLDKEKSEVVQLLTTMLDL